MKPLNFCKALVILCLSLFSAPVFAYVNPGAGITFIGSLIGLVVGLVLLVVGLVLWPIRAYLQSKKDKDDNDGNDKQENDTESEQENT